MPSSSSDAAANSPADARRRGIWAAFAAYGLWGVFPLYFAALAPASPWEILAHRIVWTLITCVIALTVRRDWGWLRDLLSRPALAIGVMLAGVFIAVNWGTYVWAVRAGRTTDAALGYFLNPLVTIALGVLILHERLRRTQWLAVGIGLVAGVYLSVAAGGVPWASLLLAGSFALYGLLKNRVGVSLDPWQSLAAEGATLTPFAIAFLVVLQVRGTSTFVAPAGWHTALLVLSGLVTAIPLLLFAAAARAIPLVLVGLIQFFNPVLQLIVGVVFMHERMSTPRWIGFGIVWIALAVLAIDSLLALRRQRATAS